MNWKSEKFQLFLMISIFAPGTVGHLISELRPFILLITPYILLFFILLILIPIAQKSRKALYWFLVTYVVTFVLEVAGVKTGAVFGFYHYGSSLGPKLEGVPLIIGANWVVVVLGAIVLAEKISDRTICIVMITGAISTLFDWIMEPVAVELDYWSWHNGVIPMRNYVAWFLIASLATGFYRFLRLKVGTRTPLFYLFVQIIFFTVLNIF